MAIGPGIEAAQLEGQEQAQAQVELKGKQYTSKSPMQIALRRLAYDKVAMLSLGMVLFFVLIAIFAGTITKAMGLDPTAENFDLLGPNTYPTFTASWEHPFGIESGMGRDLFSRWMLGSRPSLMIAVICAVSVTIIGTVMGLLAGFLGGWVDRVISWIIDVFLSMPFLLFAIALVPIFVSRFGHPDETGYIADEKVAGLRFAALCTVLIVFGWTGLARLIRGEVMALREREYVQAARALGVPTHQILFKEIVPNLLGPIIVSLSVAIPAYVSAEAGLSLLGIGLREPSMSWGLTIAGAQQAYQAHPLYLWMPVLGVSLLVLSLSLLGDAINDAFNPNTRR